jgi:hypothetical protein
MPEPVAVLEPWSNFYIVAGTAAATLTGLMFVVISLVDRSTPRSHDAIAMFSTPTVLHFCEALFVSAVLIAPWKASLGIASLLIAGTGIYGISHVAWAVFRARRVRTYKPDIEDWISYTAVPIVAYITITAGAVYLNVAPARALFVLAGAIVLLIFIGIRNAWDTSTYIIVSDDAEPKALVAEADSTTGSVDR